MPPRRRHATISIRYAQRILDAARARGVAIGPLCRAAELELSLSADPDHRISADQYLRLWGAAMAAVDDPAFPLHVAQVKGMDELGVLGLTCKTCANVEQAFDRARRYLPLATDAAHWVMEETRDGLEVVLARGSALSPHIQYVDQFALAELVWAGRMISGVDWAPRAVELAHAAPAHPETLHAFFGVPVQFERERSKLSLRRATLQLPLLKADDELLAFLDAHAQSLLATIGSDEPLLHAVRRTVRRLLDGSVPTLPKVAKLVAISERTLRRRLDDSGTSFRKLVDEVRCEWAQQELVRARLGRDEIAERLGFSDTTAFHRAFRRWTGVTPMEYARMRLQPPARRNSDSS